MATFGARLHDAMIVRGIGVSQFAKELGVTRQTVARWFAMKTADLSGHHLMLAARLLLVRASWLAFGFHPMMSVTMEQERQVHLSAMER